MGLFIGERRIRALRLYTHLASKGDLGWARRKNGYQIEVLFDNGSHADYFDDWEGSRYENDYWEWVD